MDPAGPGPPIRFHPRRHLLTGHAQPDRHDDVLASIASDDGMREPPGEDSPGAGREPPLDRSEPRCT